MTIKEEIEKLENNILNENAFQTIFSNTLQTIFNNTLQTVFTTSTLEKFKKTIIADRQRLEDEISRLKRVIENDAIKEVRTEKKLAEAKTEIERLKDENAVITERAVKWAEKAGEEASHKAGRRNKLAKTKKEGTG